MPRSVMSSIMRWRRGWIGWVFSMLLVGASGRAFPAHPGAARKHQTVMFIPDAATFNSRASALVLWPIRACRPSSGECRVWRNWAACGPRTGLENSVINSIVLGQDYLLITPRPSFFNAARVMPPAPRRRLRPMETPCDLASSIADNVSSNR
jgi:hypothetical protein